MARDTSSEGWLSTNLLQMNTWVPRWRFFLTSFIGLPVGMLVLAALALPGNVEAAAVAAALGFAGGAIAALDLVVMKDTKGAQMVYAPAPTIRDGVLDAHPKIRDLLDPVFASLDTETLRGLNAKIAVEGQDARTVATTYLKSKGFLN